VTPEHRALLVKQYARDLGFDDVGITDLSRVPHAEALVEWLRSGMAATMTYMHRQLSRRLEPAKIVAGATRAVVVSRNYFTPDGPANHKAGRVAKYARGRDYHSALVSLLNDLATYIESLGNHTTVSEAYVDAGPVPERELGQRAGLGWIGKNTMLISPDTGSFFFLATVLTSLDLAVDPPFEADRCGSCQRCLEACPTDALCEPRMLDSRRCISYLTIEHPGDIADELQPRFGRWIFGCDICQDVCPWNVKFAHEADDEWLSLDRSREYIALEELCGLTDHEFSKRYGWTALERPGLRGMRRNVRIAAQNVAMLNGGSPPHYADGRPKGENPAD
jgi:epoxyqueuosine reductase